MLIFFNTASMTSEQTLVFRLVVAVVPVTREIELLTTVNYFVYKKQSSPLLFGERISLFVFNNSQKTDRFGAIQSNLCGKAKE